MVRVHQVTDGNRGKKNEKFRPEYCFHLPAGIPSEITEISWIQPFPAVRLRPEVSFYGFARYYSPNLDMVRVTHELIAVFCPYILSLLYGLCLFCPYNLSLSLTNEYISVYIVWKRCASR